MTEYTTIIPLAGGLRQHRHMPRNSGGFVRLLNVEAAPEGLRPYEPVRIPFSKQQYAGAGLDTLPESWPYPTILKGKGRTFVVTADGVFYVDENSWVMNEIPLYEYGTDTLAVPYLGGPWSLIEAYDTWFLTNGLSVMWHTNRAQVYSGVATEKAYVSHTPFECGTYHKGRFLMGGFSGVNISAEWTSFVENLAYAQAANPALDNNFDIDLKSNFVLWSSIGGGNWPEWLFDDIVAGNTQNVMDAISRNDMGWAVLPTQGYVRVLKPLGDAIIAYCDNGIVAMRPVGGPVPTYQFVKLTGPYGEDVGVMSKSVGGDNFEHLFVDQDGRLWKLGQDLVLQFLDYQEWIQPMGSREIVVCPATKGRYFICNGLKTYVLNKGGLSESSQIVTSVIQSRGLDYGLGQYPDLVDDRRMVVRTAPIDLGSRAIKNLSWTELGIDTQGAATTVKVFNRYQKQNDFSGGTAKPVNKEGFSYVNSSGTDFEIEVEYPDYESCHLYSLKCKYKNVDRRYARGTEVLPGNAQQ